MNTGAQIRLARELLGSHGSKLAEKARVAQAAISRAEILDGEASATIVHENAIRRALRAAGIEFLVEPGGSPGLRLGQERP